MTTGHRPAAILFGLLFLISLACSGSSGSGSDRTPTQPDGAVVFETVLKARNPSGQGSARREVIRDQASWQAAWAEIQGDGSAAPAIDFSQEMVVLAAMETQGCVSDVTIRSIVREGGELAVDVLEAPPAPNCVCITSERPVHAVRLPLSEAPVRFTVERGQTTC
jgi:hypothetical protein